MHTLVWLRNIAEGSCLRMKIFAFADEASSMIEGQIAAMLRNRLDGLEIRNVDGQNISDISLEKAREVRDKLHDAGLRTWSVGSPIGKIGITEDFAPHLEQFRHTLEIAHVLEAENIRLFSFYIPEAEKPEVYRKPVMERLNQFAEVSKDSGIELCHENEKGIYGDNAERCDDILRTIPSIKCIFDPANFVQCGQETLTAWQMLRSRVKYLHIKDALPDGQVVPAGRGVGNVAEILIDFRNMGGEAVTIEPHLQVFSGLEALERNPTAAVQDGYYASSDAAFDAACAALREYV